MTVSPATVAWIVLALYGIFIQRWALSIAWRTMKTARFFGVDNPSIILAIGHVRTNAVRMFVVSSNLALGLFILFVSAPTTVTHPAEASVIAWIFSAFLLLNEFAMVVAATLEVHAHLKLRRRLSGKL